MRENTNSLEGVVNQEHKSSLQHLTSSIGLPAGLIVVVCIAVFIVHWPGLSARALYFDDNQYLTENSLVQNPGWASAKKFLTEILEPSTVEGYYQPLTMISLMFDYALAGQADKLRPFHRTSLILHATNTALIIVLLYLLFGHIWAATAAGLLFGLHPMTVETIIWIGERKTLLATFFFLWCLIVYVQYIRRNDWRLYITCMVMYILALMSKPTSISLPVLMLLVDFWPLRRFNRRAVLEKLPFLAVGCVFAIITFISQSRTASVITPEKYEHGHIFFVLCHNIIFYLFKIILPINLSPHYAFPVPLGLSNPMVAAGVIGTCILIPLLLISLRWTRSVLTGWLFFFAAIFPTMGVIGFTNVIASDKFAYLPATGLLMLLVSLLSWICRTDRLKKRLISCAAAAMIVLILAGVETVVARRYMVHWRNRESLCEYILKLTPDAAPVHTILGRALESQGRIDEAAGCYRRTLHLKPDDPYAHYNLANLLKSQGKLDEAIGHYRRILQIKPNHFNASNNLGNALAAQGKFNEAIYHYHQTLQIKPDYANAHCNMGTAFKSQGVLNEAIRYYYQALNINPDFAEAHSGIGISFQLQGNLNKAIEHYRLALRAEANRAGTHNNLGSALLATGQYEEAIHHFKEAVRLKPDYLTSLNATAWITATHPDSKLRDANVAVEFAERAAKLTTYQNATVLDILAAAYAAANQFDLAAATAKKALELASVAQDNDLAGNIQKRLELYRQGKPYRQSAQ